jgi:hypothetical protein
MTRQVRRRRRPTMSRSPQRRVSHAPATAARARQVPRPAQRSEIPGLGPGPPPRRRSGGEDADPGGCPADRGRRRGVDRRAARGAAVERDRPQSLTPVAGLRQGHLFTDLAAHVRPVNHRARRPASEAASRSAARSATGDRGHRRACPSVSSVRHVRLQRRAARKRNTNRPHARALRPRVVRCARRRR